ncbi:MAG TPA: hypothetical protein VMC86_04725, partial [Gemmatimonadales bacterium]|nr:hypothetical protein [Gemmatimonadales bacterium]
MHNNIHINILHHRANHLASRAITVWGQVRGHMPSRNRTIERVVKGVGRIRISSRTADRHEFR